MTKVNFYVPSLFSNGTEGIYPLDIFLEKFNSPSEAEAYYCVFNLVKEELKVAVNTGKIDQNGKVVYDYVPQTPELNSPLSSAKYEGYHEPAFGYVAFDFDDPTGDIEKSKKDAKAFVEWVNGSGVLVYYSGSKGFHVYVPFGHFGLEINPVLKRKLHGFATVMKTVYPTMDTTVFNANRKFRVPGSRHGKTGRFKTLLPSIDLSVEEIFALSKTPNCRGIPTAPVVGALPHIGLFFIPDGEHLGKRERRRFIKSDGRAALEKCAFLKHVCDEPLLVNEPEWYAAASIIGHFTNGRTLFQKISEPHPNYSPEETDKKLDQALMASGPRTCENIDKIWGKCNNCPLNGKIKSPASIISEDVIPSEAEHFYYVKVDKHGNETYIPQYDDLLSAFKRDYQYLRDPKIDKTYTYSDGYYQPITDYEVKNFAEIKMEPKPKESIRREFLSKINVNELLPTNEIDHFFFDSIKGTLNLENGVLTIGSGVLEDHSPEYGFRYKLPYKYDPTAKCPRFDKFLDEITLGRDGLKQTLLEFMGYCMWPGYEEHCFLWLSGGGRNGKSAYTEVIRGLVGEMNCSSVFLDKFSTPNYLERMNHKLANFSEEADAKIIAPHIMMALKALSAGGTMEVDQKYEVPFTMRGTAKLVFASNSPPILSGTEDAMKSRMIVVPFDMMLEDHMTGENKVNSNIVKELMQELPGILNLSLAALNRFLTRKIRKIHRSDESKEALQDIMLDSDPVERWLENGPVQLNPLGQCYMDELFVNFQKETMDEKFQPDAAWFGRRLKQKFQSRINTRHRERDGDKMRRVVRGLDFTPNGDPVSDKF